MVYPATSSTPALRFLIVEGNTPDIRESYRAGIGRSPAESYGDVILDVAGGGVFDVICAADADAALPKGMTFADYDGVVITGSSLNVWQGTPDVTRQIEMAKAIYRANVPFFGSCWGLQIAAVAAGGAVQRNPRGREVGFARKVMVNAAGRAHPLLAGRNTVFDAPCTHLDEVTTLPPQASLLASNAMSQVQAAEFRHEGGTFWGVQYHPEYSLKHMAYLIDKRINALVDEGFFTDAAAKKAYADDLDALHANPALPHLAWRYGLEADVLEPRQRLSEIHNFMEHRVRPHAMRRAA